MARRGKNRKVKKRGKESINKKVMTDRREKQTESERTKEMAEKVRAYENEDKHCKDRAPSPGLFRAKTPSDSTRKTGGSTMIPTRLCLFTP